MNKIYLYKSLSKGLNSYYGKKKWKIGKWYTVKGKLKMCGNGFHASERILYTMNYVPMECLAKVEVKGDHLKQDDKQCWREMRIAKAWKWTKKDSVALAIYSAELAIDNFEKEYPDDKRPREAINAAKRWLKNPTEENRRAAESAESAAVSAESAISSAGSVAESAVRAAWSAAMSAGSVAESAESAAMSAGSAITKKIETWIQRRINKLEEIK